ncbi:uncharacterized protein (TIGR02646 family) [Sphingobacterium zeae]|uniref:Uncharacterized protein (TIGR02646 family) n=1 Tax=Sphingobacterium zeae TaxID=1776859 RepID=A0ABU0U6B2_9SPHI|nr:AAA family ATPase [Sphingobacterium zeae]MDQ1150502.1 uncharacterized protein (TIGR02646 family) [Sphingobacterium zeae]
MISVFKNFYDRPVSLNIKELNIFYKDLSVFIETNPTMKLKDFPNSIVKKYSKPDVKKALSQLYNHKCAYCEQKTDLTIEHYRPKTKYSWLSLEWSNMLPVCYNCSRNRTDKFLIKGKEINMAQIQFVDNSLIANMPIFKNEQPLLLHPEVDSPENHISFDSNGNAVGRTEKGRYTIDVYSLNRDLLIQKRSSIVSTLQDELRELVKDFFQSTFVLNGDYFVSKIGKDFENFYKRLYKLQSPTSEFTSLYRSIWEKDLIENVSFVDDQEYNNHIYHQLLIWKKIFVLNRNKLIKTKFKSAIVGFELQNFEGIRHISLSEIDASTRWIFLTGENGYGKTSILKAIAVGLVGRQKADDEARFKIDVLSPSTVRYRKSVDDKDYYDINQFIWQNDMYKPYTSLAVYGANRTQMSDNYKNPSEENVLDSIFGEKTELLNVERFLIDTYDRPELKRKFESIVIALKKVVPQLSDIFIDTSRDILEVKYKECTEEGDNFLPVSFNELATGMKAVLAMVGDILCRFMINKPIDDTRDIKGIVIIDEIDIHLHPKWQKALPTLLSDVFPDVQFIASTHSAIPLLGAPKDSVFLKVNRSLAFGVQLERLSWFEENLPNMLPNVNLYI